MVTSLLFTAGISLHSDVHTCEFRIHAYFPVFDVILSCLSPEEGGSCTDMLSETSLVHTSIHFFISTLSFYKSPALIHMLSSYPMLSKVKYLNKSSKIYYGALVYDKFFPTTWQRLLFLSYQFLKNLHPGLPCLCIFKELNAFWNHINYLKNLLTDIIVQIFEFSSSLDYLDLLDYILHLHNICNFISC